LNGKSPGTDGLPVEFYKIFWKNIKKLVMNSFSYSYENENMSISQKQSIITLLPQKNNDVRRPSVPGDFPFCIDLIALAHSSSDIIPSHDSFSFSFNFGISAKLETCIFTKYRLQDNDKMYCDTIKK
jgi:hypothetical protein